VGDVRQLGFMAGVELAKDKEKGIPFPYGERTGFKVAYKWQRKECVPKTLGRHDGPYDAFGGGKRAYRSGDRCSKAGYRGFKTLWSLVRKKEKRSRKLL